MGALTDADRVIAGLETVPGPATLAEMTARIGPERLIFSLDLKAGEPLASAGWPERTPLAIVGRAIALGVTSLLILDLSRVGLGSGTGTDDLAATLRRDFPLLELTTGGGVAGRADLDRLVVLGIDNVLVASALHDRRL